MNIPQDVNTRAEDMWRIISQKVDFRKKSVIDLGCGHGEMLWRAYVAGAEKVYGIDKRSASWDDLHDAKRIFISSADINDMISGDWFIEPHKNCNIAFCFSVIPYLDKPLDALHWMADNFELCLLEIQYDPEPYNIGPKDDAEMFSLLRNNGFDIVMNIGRTRVEIRDTYRTIWACSARKVRL